jgi:two-component system, chemotaxis family, CheB/CheR fusion protein
MQEETGEAATSPAIGAPQFPIVGIGASAGGLAAFEAFFSTMPADSDPGMAFVLVQHLARDHKSILADLIGRYTRMEVFEVEDGIEVRPNCAYIIPPNRDMFLAHGKLHLQEPTLARGVRLPIDFLFRSLAQDQRERAICVVLSGTGSDGALGARAVKGEGGMVMVQTPESTEYDGMPRSAIAIGTVDFVLLPEEMPAQLLAYTERTFGPANGAKPAVSIQVDELGKIFQLLRSQTGHDFSLYKRNTIIRRVERRMAVHQIDRLEDYVRYLQLTRGEVDALFRDLLIGVTNFFRDTEIFEEIEKTIIPKLFESKPAGSVIRVWVPGCSTGEEPYSLAILLREYLEEHLQNHRIQLFATDIDREAIDHARAGIYPSSIVADVSAERLAKYFVQGTPEDSTYRINKTIRDMVVFSEHDLIKDPPFSKLDLISCRNLLIYMSSELQQRLMPLFHYALVPDGILLLGSSESVGEAGNLFSALDRTAKIFQRKGGNGIPSRVDMARITRPPVAGDVSRMWPGGVGPTKASLYQLAERAVMRHFAPVGALVNERGDILYLFGRTGRYLEPAPGEAAMNIFRMAREGLRGDLTIALHRAVSLAVVTRNPGLRVRSEGGTTIVNLTVLPVAGDEELPTPPGLFLVLLEEAAATEARSTEGAVDAVDAVAEPLPDLNEYILRLKQELRTKEEYLQTAVEELETSNEELRSAHEEMQSVNEEMQSTNEELETSKEELQSVNEELATVNSELQVKVVDLSRSNDDMNNLLSGTGIGTIFVDHDLRILRFTPTISALINLIETDTGRPVDQIRSNLETYDGLAADVRDVLATLAPKELEVQAKSGEWYLLKIRPYRTLENVIEGAVITFTDISALKKAEAVAQDSQALRRLAVVVRDSRDAIIVQDLGGRITAWNPGAVRLYGWSEAEALERSYRSLLAEAEAGQAMAELRLRAEGGKLEPLRQARVGKDGQPVQVALIPSVLVNDSGEVYAIATTERAS